ncbi:neuronal acetylcholine receptor subunit alpha-7-like [Parasteatoda tepidariorum]|uniref:neuronal acetylcholine receptor subunit alpha-7-like n=1 Tax=Parasteatoda tepidariorum TaxID=114398 RepID=UPI00077F9400|nr:neuronal acetylcholine receptor subunit alpha-7-like [Parasteatoda tepidariorum]
MNFQLMYLACLCAFLGFACCNPLDDIFQDVYGRKTERDLREHLFKNYDKLVRPVKNANDKITVSVGITPLHLRDFDEKHQVIVLETYTMLNWTDDYLRWDPSRFEDLSVLRLPSTEVWRPDVSVYGSPEQSVMAPVPFTNVLLYNTGRVLWVPMFTIRSRCPMLKASKKIVTCNIQLGSWTYDQDTQDIALINNKVDLSNFVDNNANWKLIDVVSNRVAKYYPCCKEAYPVLNFNVTLKRRSRSELQSNGVLDEEDVSINLQDVVLSDFSEADKLLRR